MDGRYVTLLQYDGNLFCIDSTCYHAGGPLGLGDIEELLGEPCIVCPWHMYKVTLTGGEKLYQSLEMGPDRKLVPGGWKKKEMAQRVHKVARKRDGLYVQLNTEGRYDSDEYGKSALCGERCAKGDKSNASAGRDGGVKGGYGSNKFNALPKRSGYVLNPSAATLDEASKSWTSLKVESNEKEGVAGFRLRLKALENDLAKLFPNGFPSGTVREALRPWHVKIGVVVDEEFTERPYTPIRLGDDLGFLEFSIRMYEAGEVSSKLAQAKAGDSISVKLGDDVPGNILGDQSWESFTDLGLVAGGSGVTPIVQIAENLANNPSCTASITIVVANTSLSRVLCMHELGKLAKKRSSIKVVHLISKEKDPREESKYQSTLENCSVEYDTRISSQVLSKLLGWDVGKSNKGKVLVWCGPPGFNQAVRKIAKESYHLNDGQTMELDG